MPPEKQWFFRQLDDFAREHCRCFLAELFASQDQVEYIACFRPVGGVRGLPAEQYACRYLRFSAADVDASHREERLIDSIIEKLVELTTLGWADGDSSSF